MKSCKQLKLVALILAFISISALFLTSCSSTQSNIYKSPKVMDKKVKRIAIMPMVILAASKTTVAGTYTSTWISETWTTMAMSPAEMLPAEQVYVEALSTDLKEIDLINPRIIDERMKGQQISTFDKAVLLVADNFDADAVMVMKIRNLNLRGGGHFESHTGKGDGHVDLSLYDSNGTILWAVSSEVKYEKGTFLFNIIPDTAPSLADFVEYTMTQMKLYLIELSNIIS